MIILSIKRKEKKNPWQIGSLAPRRRVVEALHCGDDINGGGLPRHSRWVKPTRKIDFHALARLVELTLSIGGSTSAVFQDLQGIMRRKPPENTIAA